jgi:hypothetical protein
VRPLQLHAARSCFALVRGEAYLDRCRLCRPGGSGVMWVLPGLGARCGGRVGLFCGGRADVGADFPGVIPASPMRSRVSSSRGVVDTIDHPGQMGEGGDGTRRPRALGHRVVNPRRATARQSQRPAPGHAYAARMAATRQISARPDTPECRRRHTDLPVRVQCKWARWLATAHAQNRRLGAKNWERL